MHCQASKASKDTCVGMTLECQSILTSCNHLAGLCEMHLVEGWGLCGHCKAVGNCCRECLAAHWWLHRDPAAAVAACEVAAPAAYERTLATLAWH